MTYKIARDSQEFGPYSLSDIQRYVGTGNILLTDLAQAEGAADWIPVSQVVGTIAVPPPQTFAPNASMAQYPDPPNLHWALVLLFGILSCGLFLVIWDLVEVLWLKKVEPGTKAFSQFLLYIGLYGVNLVLSVAKGSLFAGSTSNPSLKQVFTIVTVISAILSVATVVMMIVYRFTMRSALERHFNGPDPVGLSLSGVMTFFFGGLYFQYHFNRINEIKRAYRLTHPY